MNPAPWLLSTLLALAPASEIPQRPADYGVQENGSIHLEAPERMMDWVGEFAGPLEAFKAETEAFLGTPLQSTYVFRVCANRKEFERAMPEGRRAPAWAAGLAFADYGYTIIDLSKVGHPREAQLLTTLKHEGVHLWVGEALGDAYGGRRLPRWFAEAIAMHLAEEWSLERMMQLVGRLVPEEAPTLAQIDREFHNQHDASPAYLMAQQFLEHLVMEHGPETFRAWVRLMAETPDGFHASFQQVYGFPLDFVESEWRSKMNRSYRWLPIIGSTTFVWALMAILLVIAWRRKRQPVWEEEQMSYLEELNARLDERWSELEQQKRDGNRTTPDDQSGGPILPPPPTLH